MFLFRGFCSCLLSFSSFSAFLSCLVCFLLAFPLLCLLLLGGLGLPVLWRCVLLLCLLPVVCCVLVLVVPCLALLVRLVWVVCVVLAFGSSCFLALFCRFFSGVFSCLVLLFSLVLVLLAFPFRSVALSVLPCLAVVALGLFVPPRVLFLARLSGRSLSRVLLLLLLVCGALVWLVLRCACVLPTCLALVFVGLCRCLVFASFCGGSSAFFYGDRTFQKL